MRVYARRHSQWRLFFGSRAHERAHRRARRKPKKRVSALTDGTIFGEMGLLDGAPRSASVTASRDSVCYAIYAGQYADLQAHNPDLVATLLGNVSRQFSSRLRVANIMIAELDQ